MGRKSWKPILNVCPNHREDSRFHQVELMALEKENPQCSCRTALPGPGKFLKKWQENQTKRTLLINYHLVGPHYQITFNLQARPAQGMDFSPLSVLCMMICWLSLISAGVEEVERLCYLQALCSWAGVHHGEAQILCTRERKMDERELQPCTLPVLCCMEGKLHPSKSQKGRSLPNPIWRCCRAGNWPLIRDAEISLLRRALFQPMEFHGGWTGKTCQKKFYRVGKCSKLYQKLFSACQKLSALCQRVAISASPIFLVLHCASWHVK